MTFGMPEIHRHAAKLPMMLRCAFRLHASMLIIFLTAILLEKGVCRAACLAPYFYFPRMLRLFILRFHFTTAADNSAAENSANARAHFTSRL